MVLYELQKISLGLVILLVPTVLLMDPSVILICCYLRRFIIFHLLFLEMPGTDSLLCSSYNFWLYFVFIAEEELGP